MEGFRPLILAVAVVLILMAITVSVRESKNRFTNWTPELASGYPYNFGETPRLNGNCAMGDRLHMHSSAEADPLITGRLYTRARAAGTGRRWVYSERTAHKDGGREFSPGVDVGPLGMRAYSIDGTPDVFDDGIPENWLLPSTPVTWKAPPGLDFYDVEARQARVYDKHFIPPQEPDHDPLFN